MWNAEQLFLKLPNAYKKSLEFPKRYLFSPGHLQMWLT